MFDSLTKLHKTAIALVFFIALVITAMNYVTPASAFNEHVRKQELDRLYNLTMQYEINYNCYRQSCQGKMPPELYTVYVSMLNQIKELENK